MPLEAITPRLARFAIELRYDQIPLRVIENAKLQVLSVLGATFAGSRSAVCKKILSAVRGWSGTGSITVIGHREPLPLHHALYANCAFSMVHDFDDYLFAGHTGHSAVLPALAWAEKFGRPGSEALAAAVAANEVGGRLGAAFLLGPQNGQMWSYIHLLEAACVAGRFLGMDSATLNHAIGIAFTQPPYPLIPAFFGPDSKATLAGTPALIGTQAAELAAHGVTGAPDILGGRDGFVRRVSQRPLWFVFSGYGGAWLTDSLCFKLYPGCAYIDTAVDALDEIETQRGKAFDTSEIAEIRCDANYLTSGMETLSIRYGEQFSAITVNFSVALSLALKILGGGLATQSLEYDYLMTHREQLSELARRIRVEHDPEMSRAMSGLDSVGIDLGRYLSATGQERPASEQSGGGAEVRSDSEPTLDGVSFEHYTMAFPVRLTVKTNSGHEFVRVSSIPRGGAGRAPGENRVLVREKFIHNASASIGRERAEAAARTIERMEHLRDIRELTALLSG